MLKARSTWRAQRWRCEEGQVQVRRLHMAIRLDRQAERSLGTLTRQPRWATLHHFTTPPPNYPQHCVLPSPRSCALSLSNLPHPQCSSLRAAQNGSTARASSMRYTPPRSRKLGPTSQNGSLSAQRLRLHLQPTSPRASRIPQSANESLRTTQ